MICCCCVGVSPGLVVLDASSCGLTGTIPPLTGGSLSELYLLNNSLSGAVPGEPGAQHKCRCVWVSQQ
jgi:hypothetical protein